MPLVGDYILHLFNSILTSSKYPKNWKLAKVIPIPKTGTSYKKENLRPISILPILSKVFEHVIRTQIMNHIVENSLLNDQQTGYRSSCSASSALLGITESLRKNMNRGIASVLVSLDLSKAFDRINHLNLVKKLRDEFAFSRTACLLIYSYLTDRKQFVSFGGRESHQRDVKSGIAQGSVLGPLLFSMYLNGFFNMIESEFCCVYAFADDIQLLIHGETSEEILIRRINTVLDLVNSWMVSNFLILNINKTRIMKFGSLTLDGSTIHIDQREIVIVDRMKILGIILDDRLVFSYHIDSVYKKVCFTLRRLYCLNIYLPYHIRIKVAHALLMSQISYGMHIFLSTTSSNINKIRILLNKIVRFVFGISLYNHNIYQLQNNQRNYNHISPYVERFLKCSFKNFVTLRYLLIFYKIIKSSTPQFLLQLFNFIHSTRNVQICIPRINNTVFDRSFLITVARTWNHLPNDLRSFSFSYTTYRRKLTEYFNRNQN